MIEAPVSGSPVRASAALRSAFLPGLIILAVVAV